MRFTESIGFDVRLAFDDLTGSAGHVAMLGHVGILGTDETTVLLAALESVRAELADGSFMFAPTDEDIHTAIERRVTELTGPVGGKLHTGRSRNDQCVTALRLWCKREFGALAASVLDLAETFAASARRAGVGEDGAVIPAYTHVQRAQPVLLAHHLLAHSWALLRDVERLHGALQRVDVSPLGAGAVAGSSLPLDPDFTARRLGFSARFENSMDAVSDRDFVAELLFVLGLTGVHLSRIGEEWVLWTSTEFGFAKLDDRYATGSSMLPQKKNADIAELTRGKSGRLIGNLTGLLATLKGLPLSYNRDLQEDKEPLFDSFDQVRLAIAALDGMVRSATFDTDRLARAANDEFLYATDIAEWLVARGTPFREAHAIVGEHVRTALETGRSLGDLVAGDARLGADALAVMRRGVANRTSPGGGGPVAVAAQLERFDQRVNELRRSLT
jgi:argininosuccinate lyase